MAIYIYGSLVLPFTSGVAITGVAAFLRAKRKAHTVLHSIGHSCNVCSAVCVCQLAYSWFTA